MGVQPGGPGESEEDDDLFAEAPEEGYEPTLYYPPSQPASEAEAHPDAEAEGVEQDEADGLAQFQHPTGGREGRRLRRKTRVKPPPPCDEDE